MKEEHFPGWKQTPGCNTAYADSKTIPSEWTDEFSYHLDVSQPVRITSDKVVTNAVERLASLTATILIAKGPQGKGQGKWSPQMRADLCLFGS